MDLDAAQALIVTSRNALRALSAHRHLDKARKLPLFAVGEATAAAARELGFAEVTPGPGTGAGLAGADRIQGADPPTARSSISPARRWPSI